MMIVDQNTNKISNFIKKNARNHRGKTTPSRHFLLMRHDFLCDCQCVQFKRLSYCISLTNTIWFATKGKHRKNYWFHFCVCVFACFRLHNISLIAGIIDIVNRMSKKKTKPSRKKVPNLHKQSICVNMENIYFMINYSYAYRTRYHWDVV